MEKRDMNVLVYDVAAENGGAASILEYYYGLHSRDKNNHYYYVLSTYHLKSRKNITVIRVPFVKKSWLHRICFDYFGSRKMLKRFHIDRVLSLQNLHLPSFKGVQTIYVHNALPFCEYRFGLKEDPKMWVYQNIIGRMMYRSIKKADRVIVQTKWMKDAIRKKCRCGDKVEVSFPEVSIPEDVRYKGDSGTARFFYPANASGFKNHRVIIDACKDLMGSGDTDFEVLFTLNGSENGHIDALRREAEECGINVKWTGILPREEVFRLYETSILLFPSYIETVGLPIYEAMQVGSPIIVTNCRYAKDLTEGYAKRECFDYEDASRLAEIMRKHIRKKTDATVSGMIK